MPSFVSNKKLLITVKIYKKTVEFKNIVRPYTSFIFGEIKTILKGLIILQEYKMSEEEMICIKMCAYCDDI